MSAVLKSVMPVRPAKPDDKGLWEKFAGRKSDELIIAFAGPMGCGITSVIDGMVERLKERGYTDVVQIKLSKFLDDALTKKLVPEWTPEVNSSARRARYRRLQEAGKELRKLTKNPAILAEYAAQEIAVDRIRRQKQIGEVQEHSPIVPGRVAYLIDQVKRPEEVALLRTVYRNLFYLAGVTRVYDRRVAALEGEFVRKDEVHGLMEIDRLEGGDDGQQLDKSLHLADYFIRNDATTTEDKKQKLNRFLDLVHGNRSVTPTHAEYGMYSAYCAGLRSACLSRQVGAAIASPSGEIIATGCNDVPKAGGGLYSESAGVKDMRCVHLDGQQCVNDSHKKQLRDEIGHLINTMVGEKIDVPEQEELLDAIYKKTRLKDLIEFSRSVHAEMDAIVSLSRIGGVGLENATLYTTTFPCHSCARHIVAAGITRVFYVEPYEKSLAKDLHSDAIAFEIEESTDKKPKFVEFLHFEGVAPRQFHSMFRAVSRKDSLGKFIPIQNQQAEKVLPEYLDNYQDFEKKAVEHLAIHVKLLKESVVDKGLAVSEDESKGVS